jgi:hypothetical protein
VKHGRNASALAVPILLAIATVTSCTGGGPQAAPGPALPARAAAALGTGVLYVDAGPDPTSTNLWQIDLPSGKALQLTHNPRQYGVSNFHASTAGLVMGDAATSVDVLDALWNGKVIQIGDGNGDAPIINNQGQIANQLDPPDLNKPGGYFSIILRNNAHSLPRVIYRERRFTNLFTIDWSPDGKEMLILESPDSNAYEILYYLTTAGRVVGELRLQGGPLVQWGPQGLALSNDVYARPSPNEVISPSGKVLYRIPGNWMPRCWNPAGNELLVIRQSGAVGLWKMSDPGRVHDLGNLPFGQLSQCSWLSRRAAGT